MDMYATFYLISFWVLALHTLVRLLVTSIIPDDNRDFATVDINEYWESTPGTGNGVVLSNITFSVSCFTLVPLEHFMTWRFQNWDGYIVDGSKRSAINIICADGVSSNSSNCDEAEIVIVIVLGTMHWHHSKERQSLGK
jgi:hypothetical protein